jgi:hypothetical protein
MNGESGADLGRSVSTAYQFLRGIHQDTSQLLAALDGAMAERHWRATEKSRVSWALSNGLKPNRWLADYLFRWYVPTGTELNNIRVLIAYLVRFAPLRAVDQPVLFGAAVRFRKSPPYKKGLKAPWRKYWKDLDTVIAGLVDVPGPRPLATDQIERLLPESDAVGMILPLTGLRDSESVRANCVAPLFATLATLPG